MNLSIHIPVWLLWLLGIPLSAILFFTSAVGIYVLFNVLTGRWPVWK